YVIMNAGDELAMTFPAPAPPSAGWTRDFVLIGDGWEKDGDYNTEYSAPVRLGALSYAAHPAGRVRARSGSCTVGRVPLGPAGIRVPDRRVQGDPAYGPGQGNP